MKGEREKGMRKGKRRNGRRERSGARGVTGEGIGAMRRETESCGELWSELVLTVEVLVTVAEFAGDRWANGVMTVGGWRS